MSDYRPIDCEFHDELEARSTLRRRCVLEFRRAGGGTITEAVAIEDFFQRDGAEWMLVTNGAGAREDVRLDWIVAVDGIPRP